MDSRDDEPWSDSDLDNVNDSGVRDMYTLAQQCYKASRGMDRMFLDDLMIRVADDKPTCVADLCSYITMAVKWYDIFTLLGNDSELCTQVLHELKNVLGSHLD